MRMAFIAMREAYHATGRRLEDWFLTNRQIAERLVVAENTVRAHLRNILDKLHVNNRVQAALLLRQENGL